MIWIENAWGTVWEVMEERDRWSKIRFSTSEKDQEGNYTNSNWFPLLVGAAHEKVDLLKGKDRVRIKVLKGKVAHPSKKQPDGSWRNYLNLTIIDFELADAPVSNIDNPPIVESSGDDDDLPF